jgi:hypothetical protein
MLGVPRNHELAENGLLAARKVLDGPCQNGYMATWWLHGGTLLGAMKRQDFIAHDDDLDIAVVESTDFRQLADAFTKAGFYVLRINKHDMTVAVPGARTNEPWDIHLDIFKTYVDGSKMYQPTDIWEGRRLKYTRMVFPLVTNIIRIELFGKMFPVPENWDAYLCASYPHWRTCEGYGYSYTDSTNYE